MKYSMTGQEKGDCLIEVTVWTGLTLYFFPLNLRIKYLTLSTSINSY
jgi:hypothetical protein